MRVSIIHTGYFIGTWFIKTQTTSYQLPCFPTNSHLDNFFIKLPTILVREIFSDY